MNRQSNGTGGLGRGVSIREMTVVSEELAPNTLTWGTMSVFHAQLELHSLRGSMGQPATRSFPSGLIVVS